MKIKLKINSLRKTELFDAIKNDQYIEVDNDYQFIILEYGAKIVGYKGPQLFEIHYDDIICFESLGNDVYIKTLDEKYLIKDRLYRIEERFQKYDFLRVNKSYVINMKKIKSIYPLINSKFILTMVDKTEIDVTRTYYRTFKEKVGI